MTTIKTFKFTVSGRGFAYNETIDAVNPPQARMMAEARYPGCKLYGFNQISGSDRNV